MTQEGPLDPEVSALMGIGHGLDQQPREENIATDFRQFSAMIGLWLEHQRMTIGTDALPPGYVAILSPSIQAYSNEPIILARLRDMGCPIVLAGQAYDRQGQLMPGRFEVGAPEAEADGIARNIEILADIFSGYSLPSDRASAHIGDYDQFPFQPLDNWQQTGRIFSKECPAIVADEPTRYFPEAFMAGALFRGQVKGYQQPADFRPGDVELYNFLAAMRGPDGERLYLPFGMEEFHGLVEADLRSVLSDHQLLAIGLKVAPDETTLPEDIDD